MQPSNKLDYTTPQSFLRSCTPEFIEETHDDKRMNSLRTQIMQSRNNLIALYNNKKIDIQEVEVLSAKADDLLKRIDSKRPKLDIGIVEDYKGNQHELCIFLRETNLQFLTQPATLKYTDKTTCDEFKDQIAKKVNAKECTVVIHGTKIEGAGLVSDILKTKDFKNDNNVHVDINPNRPIIRSESTIFEKSKSGDKHKISLNLFEEGKSDKISVLNLEYTDNMTCNEFQLQVANQINLNSKDFDIYISNPYIYDYKKIKGDGLISQIIAEKNLKNRNDGVLIYKLLKQEVKEIVPISQPKSGPAQVTLPVTELNQKLGSTLVVLEYSDKTTKNEIKAQIAKQLNKKPEEFDVYLEGKKIEGSDLIQKLDTSLKLTLILKK